MEKCQLTIHCENHPKTKHPFDKSFRDDDFKGNIQSIAVINDEKR